MKIGFIGSGSMGGAIIGGIINKGKTAPDSIMVYDADARTLERIKDKYGVIAAESAADTARWAEVLFLCVKPAVIYGVIDEIKDAVDESELVVSIAAGQSVKRLSDAFGGGTKLIRVMPNTPALVGEGMAAVAPGEGVTAAEAELVSGIFEGFGRSEIVPESLMDTVTAISGSSPAYVFMFIEAMADAAVMGGMPRDKAYVFAAQSVLGSARMVLETGAHPAALKDMVCSPSGTTIEAVAALEREGFRNAVISAVSACIKKSAEM